MWCVPLISTEGKGSAEKVQERVGRMQQLREALREETLKSGAATEKGDLHQQVISFNSEYLPYIHQMGLYETL